MNYPFQQKTQAASKHQKKHFRTPLASVSEKNDVHTDKLISLIENDKDCSKLQKYIDLGIAITKNLHQMSDDQTELKSLSYYFILYDVMESSKHTPTYTKDGPGAGFLSNGHYECTYEVLLGTEEFTRRMVFQTKSVNCSIHEWLNDMLEELEECTYESKTINSNDNFKDLFFVK